MKKRVIYREMTYVWGMILLSLGAACITHASFGMSMVIAPSYLLHLNISQVLPWFSFGVAQSFFQTGLLILMCLVIRKFRVSYLLSFVTALIYGVALDTFVWLVGFLPALLAVRIVTFLVGMLLTAAGVAMFFRTYIAPEVYELLVALFADKFKLPVHRMKTIYDVSSCLLSIVLSFAFFGFGNFVGIGWGTIVTALLNGWLIGRFTKLYDRMWDYQDKFPNFRRFMP